MSRVVLVDESDAIIGAKERSLLLPGDIHRVSVLWITNPRGEILLAQRAPAKKRYPGTWGPAVAGTNEEGEAYVDNIIKEAKEELGIIVSEAGLGQGPKIRSGGPENDHFTQWFTYILDAQPEQLTLQEDEVAAVRWATLPALKRELTESPTQFPPSAIHWPLNIL